MWRAKTIGSCFISFLLLTKSLTVSLIGTPHIVANYPHFTTLVQPDSSPKNPLWRWRVEQFTEFYESLRELVSSGPRTLLQFSSVQSSRSVVSDSVTPWTTARQASLSITNSQSSPKLMSIESVMPYNRLSHPLSSPSPPALNLSQHQDLFKWVSSLHEVAKVLEFQLQHQSFQWTPRTDLL